jgi:hypothetical protein
MCSRYTRGFSLLDGAGAQVVLAYFLLPISREIDGGPRFQLDHGKRAGVRCAVDAADIFSPSRFFGERVPQFVPVSRATYSIRPSARSAVMGELHPVSEVFGAGFALI